MGFRCERILCLFLAQNVIMSDNTRAPKFIEAFIPVIVLIALLAFNVYVFEGDATGGPNQIALLFVSSNDGIMIPLISFLLVLIGVYFLVKLGGRLFERSVKFAWPSMLNNLFGAIVGMLKWGVLAGSLFLLIQPLDASNKFISIKTKQGSLFYNYTVGFTKIIMPGVKNTLILGYDAVLD